MDLLKDLSRKSDSLVAHKSLDGVKAAIRHIEVAERYLQRGREEREEDLFNDVIYRTNQAFEGMLKEAYAILTDKAGSSLSPHQIEQHLLQEQVFAPRVLDLFKNYRQQWRNPSTHDHKLFFSEQESLLAIVSVSAFSSILLDQMIEKVSFKQEQQDIQKTQCQIQKTLAGYRALPLLEEVIELLKLFSEELSSSTQNTKELTEVEVIGRLHGFLELLTPDISIIREPLVSNDRHLRPDLLLKKNEEAVIVEVKRPGFNKRTFDLGCAQLLAYLDASKLGNGILYVPPTKGENMEIGSSLEEIGGRSIPVHYVIPKQPN